MKDIRKKNKRQNKGENNEGRNYERRQGITIIALVVTIVVLLILAGVTIKLIIRR